MSLHISLVGLLLATASCRHAQTSVVIEPSPKATSLTILTAVPVPSSTGGAIVAPSVSAECKGLRVLDLDRSPDAPCRVDCGVATCDWTLPHWLDLKLAAVQGRPGDTIAFEVKLHNVDDLPHDLTVVDDPIAWTVDLLDKSGKDADVLPRKRDVEGCSRYFPDPPAKISLEPKATISMPLKVVARMKEAVSCKEAYGPEVLLVRKPSELFHATRPMPTGTYQLRVHVPFNGADGGHDVKEVVLYTDLTLPR